MLLHDDVVYQILQWLPVISLLRFKVVCKTWRALIESNEFIKQHLQRHHYDTNLKDKNHSIIRLVIGKDSPFTFSSISIDSFEEPNASKQLDCSVIHGYFPLTVLDIVSYNGIICLNLLNRKIEHIICLWNPATKQSRVLPQSSALEPEREYKLLRTMVGFGFDVKNNDYKVVNLCKNNHNDKRRVEVYSFNADSWRSLTFVFPFRSLFLNPRMPFNNGTCFFWIVSDSGIQRILCFDFSSEKFRSISFPDVDYFKSSLYASVVSDRIACVFNTNVNQTEIWVFKEYGSVNESWIKLHMIDPYSTVDMRMLVKWISMNGNYLFFRAMGHIIRYNVVTKEIKNLSILEKYKRTYKAWPSPTLRIYYPAGALVEYKESLMSVWIGNNE